jgi:hypothetical protein
MILLVSIAFADSVLAQTVKFNSPVNYTVGHPYVVTSGDFNGDGKADLVIGDITTNDVLVLLGNGDGTLKPPLTYHVLSPPRYLVANDFNRDGKLDLVFADGIAVNISIMLGNGDGSFGPPQSYPVGGWQVVAADFNGDGKADLLSRPTPTTLAVLLNNGSGGFQSPQTYNIPQPMVRVFAAGDFNGDGKADLVAIGRNSGSDDISLRIVTVLLGNGDGSFQAPISTNGHWGQGSGPYSVAVGDFDRDGKLDIAVTDEYLSVLKGNGDGTFKPPDLQPNMGITSVDVKVADFNGDGKLDLVAAGVFGGLQVWLGNGDGTFQNLGNLTNETGGVSVTVADLNGDMRPDIAACINSQLALAMVNATPGNPDNTDYFVHQHYVDFLDREPDAPGFGFWANQISSCGADQQCLDIKRINTSGAFYLSIEFQQTAYLIERLYKTAYGDVTGNSTNGGTAHQLSVPIVRVDELMRDVRQVNDSVVVLQPGWESVLENNKQALVSQFVQRARFQGAFPLSTTPADFVDKLNQNSGMLLTEAQRAAAIALFGGATNTNDSSARAQALRQVAETQQLYDAEKNRAFVLMQYIGYLRRNPNDAPDSDYSGYDFWLSKLNQFNGNFVQAEMVKAFITSIEYRQRFSP